LASLAERFHELFAGLEGSHGRYVLPKEAGANGKMKGHGVTVHKPATVTLWEDHLKGTYQLGVAPIRRNATVVFGAIDVDVYPLDLVKLAKKVERMGLPLVVLRTKSGGAHVALFCAEPIEARLVRTRLGEIAAALGHPKAEVYPKQDSVPEDDEEACGSWLNMPYHAGERSTRYAVDPEGKAYDPEGFLERAEALSVTASELAALEVAEEDDGASDDMLKGAPPCLQALAKAGVPDGSRNLALFDYAVYLKKRFGGAGKLDDYNRAYFDPPLGPREVNDTARSVMRKDYSYRCKDQPICAVCDKKVCRTRDFGVSPGASALEVTLTTLRKLSTQPPTWIVDVDGRRLELSTDELLDQRQFIKRVYEETLRLIPPAKPGVWFRAIQTLSETAEVIEVPEDATKEGQMWAHLARFCTGRSRAKALDEVLLGKAFADPGEGKTYFVSTDFFSYLQQHRMVASEREAFRMLKGHGVEHRKATVKGKRVTLWSVPSFSEQTEDHQIPREQPQEAM
jgi:hypothetical protein